MAQPAVRFVFCAHATGGEKDEAEGRGREANPGNTRGRKERLRSLPLMITYSLSLSVLSISMRAKAHHFLFFSCFESDLWSNAHVLTIMPQYIAWPRGVQRRSEKGGGGGGVSKNIQLVGIASNVTSPSPSLKKRKKRKRHWQSFLIHHDSDPFGEKSSLA